jgi:hypothetical protein
MSQIDITKKPMKRKNITDDLDNDVLFALTESKLWKLEKKTHDEFLENQPKKKQRHGYVFDDFVVDDEKVN